MNDGPFDLRSALVARGALLEGHFHLSSGRHSDRYVQKFRILEDPALLEPVGRALAEEFRALRPSVVVSAAVGGIPLGYEVARHLGTKAIFMEKEDGVPVLRRGFRLSGEDRALVVEDVVTTGQSVREVIDVVRAAGAQVIGVGLIVARSRIDFSVPTRALLDLPMESYEPDECPCCRAGDPLTDPGSRRLA
jgi:orotate phosphoribosyltransferase